MSRNQAAVDHHIRRVAVEDLVLSQVDKPKGTDQLVRFRKKLLKRRRAQLLSKANRISHLTR